MAGKHANFRDPMGLVWRMLRSGDTAARSALRREAGALACSPVDRMLGRLEKRLVAGGKRAQHPLVLVVGPPRSGTTVVYQVLARHLPVSYFSNLGALFPRSPLAATKLFSRLSAASREDFRNYFGNTAGLGGPNDGFHIWNRWLGEDRYRTRQQLDAWQVYEMRRYFDAWRTTFARPLLNKNNRNADCVSLLATVFDEVLFIRVRRDPIFVTQSLLLAREHIQGDRRVGWGLRSRDADAADDPLACIDDVCEQVGSIEAKLDADEARVGPERFITIDYEDFCESPSRHVLRVAERLGMSRTDLSRTADKIAPLGCTNRARLEPGELERIETWFRCAAESSAMRSTG